MSINGLRSCMDNNSGLEVALKFIDEANCVIKGDFLSEENTINDYVLTSPKIEEEKIVKYKSLREYNLQFKDCHSCNNCLGRETVYLGFGGATPLAAFIGDGPCPNDRARGKIFSGSEGVELLNWINAIKLTKQEIYITNMVKCLNVRRLSSFPCISQISDELALVKPKAIMVLGQYAARNFFNDKRTIEEYRADKTMKKDGIPVVVTYHPRDTISKKELKVAVWQDLQRFAACIGIYERIKKA